MGYFTATDVDAGSAFTYTLNNNGGGRFYMSGPYLYVGANIDYETTPTITVTATVTDNGSPSLSLTQSFTIYVVRGGLRARFPCLQRFAVSLCCLQLGDSQHLVCVGRWRQNNVNEPPTAISLSGTTVTEGVAAATVGSFSCVDPDAGQTCTFSLLSNPNNLFSLTSGVLRTAVAIAYAQYPAIVLQVTATDNGSPTQTYTLPFTIVVIYVPQQPGVSNTAMTVPENSATGALVGVISNTNPAAQLNFAMLSAGTTTAALTTFTLQACSGIFFVATVRGVRASRSCGPGVRVALTCLLVASTCGRVGLIHFPAPAFCRGFPLCAANP